MREHGVPQFTVDAHRPVGDFDLLGVSLLHRARLHQHAHRARPRRHPAARAPTATSATRSSSPAATRRSTPSRSPTSSTPPCSATARRPCCAITDVVARLEGRGAARAAARELLLRLAAHRRRLRAARSTTSTTCPTAASSGSRPNRPRRPVAGRASTPSWTSTSGRTRSSRWCRSPRPCTSGCRVEIFRGCTRGCRFCQAGMITRPVRERSITGDRRDGRARPAPRPASRRSGCSRCRSADHSEIADIAKGLADRYEGTNTCAVAAVAPASTPSTSTWPTS